MEHRWREHRLSALPGSTPLLVGTAQLRGAGVAPLRLSVHAVWWAAFLSGHGCPLPLLALGSGRSQREAQIGTLSRLGASQFSARTGL